MPGAVHVVVPADIDDPARPSGGNSYDRRVCHGLTALGWSVHEHPLAGAWPRPDAAARTALARLLAGLPDGALVLLDGLIANTVPELLLPQVPRLRPVILVHLPLGDGPPGHRVPDAAERERAVLTAAAAVLTTSGWSRDRLLARYPLPPDRVVVAEPGVDLAAPTPGTADGGRLLCVAAVTAHKGHDVLLAALARLADRPWRCTCVGSLTREPAFVARLRRDHRGLLRRGRLHLPGVLVGPELQRAYAAADVLVVASHGETYGMVATEALAHGLPVIATAVGGLPDALAPGWSASGQPGTGGLPDAVTPGWSPEERSRISGRSGLGGRSGVEVPGLLVPPGDPAALAGALDAWLGDAELRQRLRQAALRRRATLTGWAGTAARVAGVLAAVSAGPDRAGSGDVRATR